MTGPEITQQTWSYSETKVAAEREGPGGVFTEEGGGLCFQGSSCCELNVRAVELESPGNIKPRVHRSVTEQPRRLKPSEVMTSGQAPWLSLG